MSVLLIRERLVKRLSATGWRLFPGPLLPQCVCKAGTQPPSSGLSLRCSFLETCAFQVCSINLPGPEGVLGPV